MRVRTEARREAIVQEAAQLFRELGYERASMSELAQRLGGSKATLYGYFASKEELFTAVVQALADAYLTEPIDKLGLSPGEDLVAALRRFGEAFVALANEEEALAVYRMEVGEAGRSDVGPLFFQAGMRRYLDALETVLQRAIDRGDLRPGKPKVLARQFIGLLMSESEDRMFQRSPPPLTRAQVRAMVGSALEVFRHGCAKR